MPTMPDVVGLELETAQGTLQTAGVIDPNSIGYFGTWPITVTWETLDYPGGTVTTQSPAAGVMVSVNPSITLTCASFPMGCVYP